MANRKVIFDIEAENKTGKAFKESTGQLDKFKSGFQQLTGVSLLSASAIGAAGMAAQKLVQYLKSTITETEQYVTSMVDGARVTGMAVEEYSRLVQASDDLFISQEKLNTALIAASRQGIEVNAEGLEKLSSKYLSLAPGVERAQFLLKTFGRSGADMGKLMEVGAEGIDAAMASISNSLVVTEMSRVNIENYKRSVDNLSDSWQGVKYAIGNEVIPELDYLMRLLTKGVDPIEENQRAIKELEAQILRLGGAHGFSAEKVAELQAKIESLKTATTEQTSAQSFLQASVISTTTYFKALTQELLFNLAAEGLDAEQALLLAQGMGLVDSAAMAEITAIQNLREEYALTGDLDAYISKSASLAKQLEYIKSMSNININWGGSGYGGYGTSDTQYNQAAGGSGIVPQGFNHDNYMMGLSSGERWSVTPSSRVGASDKGGGGGGNTYNFNVSGINSPEQFVKLVGEKIKQQGGLPQA